MNRETDPCPEQGFAGDVASQEHGRHRAERRPGFARRAAVATVAVGAPLVPAALMAAPAAQAETNWDALAQCESSGNWAANTGNGFSGGLQFTPSTWKSFGGSGTPQNASREQQITVAERVKQAQGMQAWPVCSKKTGNTDRSPNSGQVEAVSQHGTSTKAAPKKAAPRTAPRPTKVADARTEDPSGSYTVREGDTLSGIAASRGMAWDALMTRNHDVISDPNMIFPGQTLSMA